MSLTKEFFERETNIKAVVLQDSITAAGSRVVTIEAEYPRFILAELNTHSAIEKNSSSSRAIPIFNMIAQLEDNKAVPVYWGKAKAGMQAGAELDKDNLSMAKDYWHSASRRAIRHAIRLSDIGLHKQTANRLLEPFQLMKTVLTATDLDNFFNLRIHPDAQPEILMLAYKMYKAIQASTPRLLKDDEWHLPYIHTDRDDKGGIMYLSLDSVGKETGYQEYTAYSACQISASCCAQTSYRKNDDSLEKAVTIFDKLIGADVLHASPFGHLATPVLETQRIYTETGHLDVERSVNCPEAPSTWQQGITHLRKDGQFGSGNLTGWVSYRHLLPDNTCWKFNFDSRMKLFGE